MMDTSWLFEILRQLRLVLWKNLIIRKRQFIVTAAEIILPSLLSMYFVYLKSDIRYRSALEKSTENSTSQEDRKRHENENIMVLYSFLPYCLVVIFLFIIPSTLRPIVSEKETGIKELMKMNGIPNWIHWFGWMINSLVVLAIAITIFTCVFFVRFENDTGTFFEKTDPTIWWVFMFLYIVWATSHCFILSSFFDSPTSATGVGIVIWIVSYFAAAVPAQFYYDELSYTDKILLCLSPNMALFIGIRIIATFTLAGVGQNWNNIGTPVSSSDEMTLEIVFVMLLVGSILNFILALYVEQVLVSKYGIPKPWYFIFQASEWGFGSAKEQPDLLELRAKAAASKSDRRFESTSEGISVGVEILGLRKEFEANKVALDDISMNVYKGQILCLLGHNGAGKTTTISILTGMIQPTNGTAIINGMDLRSDLNRIRQNIGLCPQHNLLFAKLTVKEHLRFFGMAKGLSSSEANEEADVLLKQLNLEEKSNEFSESLSGGQKRKLSLGCAIIGGSQVLFIDECSTGLDPEARRFIWDLLLELRNKKTIILTTHLLEEADVLGDRVAILANGKIQCCGSPIFLKNYYGTGYTLSLTVNPNAEIPNILSQIRSHVPSASIKYQNSTELSIKLPTESSPAFPQMFATLQTKKQVLKIQHIGMGLTTMEEIFLKVDDGAKNGEKISSFSNELNEITCNVTPSPKSSSGIRKSFIQFKGIFIKKMLCSLLRWRFTAIQLILPLLLTIVATKIINTTYSSGNDEIFFLNEKVSRFAHFILGIFLSIGLIFLTAGSIVMPVEEKLNHSKQLQLMTGINPLLYWGAPFTCDYLILLFEFGLILSCLAVADVHTVFTNNYGAGVLFFIMSVFGIASTLFSYLTSLLARSSTGGYALTTTINIITGTAFAVTVFCLERNSDRKDGNISSILEWTGRLFPAYGITKSTMIFANISSANNRCNGFTPDLQNTFCNNYYNKHHYTPEFVMFIQSCCDNCETIQDVTCFKPYPFFEWWVRSDATFDETVPGIAQELLYTCLISVVYLVLLILFEYGIISRAWNSFARSVNVTFKTTVTDDDVAREKERVSNLLQQRQSSAEAIVVRNLSKNYGTFSAVSNVTFGVHYGECFGLLGVNGAGKTAIFKMLTGDESISYGEAYISNKSLQTDRKSFLSHFGYCPQFDALIGVLSGSQMLHLFARLRGIEETHVTTEVDKWLKRMGLLESGSVQCQNYSGGMKRRLSTAMALIGDPPVVFLDEPTSGEDAVSRRQFWKIIASLRDTGQAIILTSHSMEECEHLCSRLGIMVNGEIQCLGAVPHLKNKFAQGFTLSLRLKEDISTNTESVRSLTTEILTRFNPCTIKDQHQSSMQFHINSTDFQWDKFFEIMETIKSQFPTLIDEYSIQETTLEEVFLSFARQQYSNQDRTAYTPF